MTLYIQRWQYWIYKCLFSFGVSLQKWLSQFLTIGNNGKCTEINIFPLSVLELFVFRKLDLLNMRLLWCGIHSRRIYLMDAWRRISCSGWLRKYFPGKGILRKYKTLKGISTLNQVILHLKGYRRSQILNLKPTVLLTLSGKTTKSEQFSEFFVQLLEKHFKIDNDLRCICNIKTMRKGFFILQVWSWDGDWEYLYNIWSWRNWTNWVRSTTSCFLYVHEGNRWEKLPK